MDILFLKPSIIKLFIMNDCLYQHNRLKINNQNYQYHLRDLSQLELSINQKIALNLEIVHEYLRIFLLGL